MNQLYHLNETVILLKEIKITENWRLLSIKSYLKLPFSEAVFYLCPKKKLDL